MARWLSIREDSHFVMQYLCDSYIQVRDRAFLSVIFRSNLARSTMFSGADQRMLIGQMFSTRVPMLRCEQRRGKWNSPQPPIQALLHLTGTHLPDIAKAKTEEIIKLSRKVNMNYVY